MSCVDSLVESFRGILISSFPLVHRLEESAGIDSLGADWLQANWELLVEGPLSKQIGTPFCLEVYGDGADANGASSRILAPASLATHKIVCIPRKRSPIRDYLNEVPVDAPPSGFPLEKLVSLGSDGWYYETPPFDAALVLDADREMVFSLKDIEFALTDMAGNAVRAPKGLVSLHRG